MSERRVLRRGMAVATLCVALNAWVEGAERGPASAELVSAENIRCHTVVLGGDALEGRAPGTRGGAHAAAYIAAELERLGVEPLGDEGSYFQQVPLIGSRPLSGCRLEISGVGEERALALGDDYLLHTTGAQTRLPQPTPMVFVGYGIVAPEFDYNDYADIDVRGKVAVFLGGEPRSDDHDFFGGGEPTVYSAVETKMRIALSRGAVASVLVPLAPGHTGAAWSWFQREYAFEHLGLAYSVPGHLGLILCPRSTAELFAEALFDWGQVMSMADRGVLRSFHLPVSLSFSGEFRTRSFFAANVVGRIPGSGKRLGEESVVVSAHYDHLGLGPAVDGDAIYNGVIDNAIGSAGLLELARVLENMPERPRRSIILLFTTAEEEGNLGAQYFLDHPPVPLSDVVANVNIDGLAFLDSFSDVVGIGAELSDLGRLLRRAASSRGIAVSRPDEFACGQQAFERSEQAVFAEAGIPAILVNEGLTWRDHDRDEAVLMTRNWMATRYHSPADDLLQPLDYDAAREHAALILTLVLMIADADLAPEWKAGVSYAYRRLLALSEEGKTRFKPR